MEESYIKWQLRQRQLNYGDRSDSIGRNIHKKEILEVVNTNIAKWVGSDLVESGFQ